MKVPIIISVIIFITTVVFLFWIESKSLDPKDFYSLIVSTSATAGALISAVFLIYGYFINLIVFKESQKPKLLFQVHNNRNILSETNENVHSTVINYQNISSNECKKLNIFVKLIKENEEIDVPRLFTSNFNFPANDNRTRSFPTKVYFLNNGIDNFVIDNLNQYKLRIGYKYNIMNETIESHYDYIWEKDTENWSIA